MAQRIGATGTINATGWHAGVQATLALVLVLAFTGCGITRCTDTGRTATEQLLISNSVDQVVSEMDFTPLAGKTVYFEPKYLDGVTDKGYLISSIRQQLLASGCLLQEDRARATYVVEARAGGVGTDRKDLVVGLPGQPSGVLPEIPLAKHTDRRGVAKVAVFAYNRTTGAPVWQSGVVQRSSTARDVWVCGAGPWEEGSLYGGTKMAGQPVQVPLAGEPHDGAVRPAVVPVTQAAYWSDQPGPQLGAPPPPPPPTRPTVVLPQPARPVPAPPQAMPALPVVPVPPAMPVQPAVPVPATLPTELNPYPLPPSGPALPAPDPTPHPSLSVVPEREPGAPPDRKPQFQTTRDANGATSITVVPRAAD
jgi:hypothetical protein